MKTKYQEVVFQRTVTRNSPDEITVSFERIKTIKQIACTPEQAAAFNAGKLNYPNPRVTLLLKDTDPDPQPRVLNTQKIDRSFDSKGNLIHEGPGWIDQYGRQDRRRNSY